MYQLGVREALPLKQFYEDASETDKELILAMQKIEWSDKVQPSKLKNALKNWIQKLGYDAMAEIMKKEGYSEEGKLPQESVPVADESQEVAVDSVDMEEGPEDQPSEVVAATKKKVRPAKPPKASPALTKDEDDATDTPEGAETNGDSPSKKGRGRPRKPPGTHKIQKVEAPSSEPKKGRGRPRKILTASEQLALERKQQSASENKRGRGRPPKKAEGESQKSDEPANGGDEDTPVADEDESLAQDNVDVTD